MVCAVVIAFLSVFPVVVFVAAVVVVVVVAGVPTALPPSSSFPSSFGVGLPVRAAVVKCRNWIFLRGPLTAR